MITTEFESRNIVLGILEVMQRWQGWLLESGVGWKLSAIVLWVSQDITWYSLILCEGDTYDNATPSTKRYSEWGELIGYEHTSTLCSGYPQFITVNH